MLDSRESILENRDVMIRRAEIYLMIFNNQYSYIRI